VSASAPIYTAGWFGVPDDALSESALAIYTAGWFLESRQLVPLNPLNPVIERTEQRKILGLLEDYITTGTGSRESPGTHGNGGAVL
jgi:hypothetical protein